MKTPYRNAKRGSKNKWNKNKWSTTWSVGYAVLAKTTHSPIWLDMQLFIVRFRMMYGSTVCVCACVECQRQHSVSIKWNHNKILGKHSPHATGTRRSPTAAWAIQSSSNGKDNATAATQWKLQAATLSSLSLRGQRQTSEMSLTSAEDGATCGKCLIRMGQVADRQRGPS